MTEAEWLASDDPQAMLAHLNHGHGPEVSDRKLRLFACACARQAWHWLKDPRSRGAVEVAERYADGLATAQERYEASLGGHQVTDGIRMASRPTGHLSWFAASEDHCLPGMLTTCPEVFAEVLPATRAALLRCVVGNPWRPVEWLRWSEGEFVEEGEPQKPTVERQAPWLTPTVRALAEAAYAERPGRECGRCHGRKFLGAPAPGLHGWIGAPPCPDCAGAGRVEDGLLDPDRLNVLADALAGEGCPLDHPVIMHLRGEEPVYDVREWATGAEYGLSRWQPLRGPHVRGCWALDLILGRE